jgi:membrane protein YdbS with pleckstrin-like domain
MTTNVSQTSHVWAHVGVIAFHVIMACLWILCTYKQEMAHDPVHRKWWSWCSYSLASLLGVFALLGLIPILMKRNEQIVIQP